MNFLDFILKRVDLSKEILIVTGANGTTGGRPGGVKIWSINCTILAWKEINRKIIIEKKTLRTKGDDKKLSDLRKQLRANGIYKIKVTDKGNDFEFQEFIGEAKDPELEAFLAEQLKPVYFQDDRFGKLKLDRVVEWFECKAEWMEKDAMLCIESIEEEAMKEMFETGYALFDNQAEWDEKIRTFACEELLKIKNKSWLGDGEDELTPEDFKKIMILEGINLNGNGKFVFWFDDGGIFGGHSITVYGSLAEGLLRAEISG